MRKSWFITFEGPDGSGKTTVSNMVYDRLVKEGYDPQYGARPLKRIIQRRIEDKLSEEILVGKIQNGQNVSIDVAGDEYIVSAW